MRILQGKKLVDKYIYICDGCKVPLDNREENVDEHETSAILRPKALCGVSLAFNFGWLSKYDSMRGDYTFCESCAALLYERLYTIFPNIRKLEDEDETL